MKTTKFIFLLIFFMVACSQQLANPGIPSTPIEATPSMTYTLTPSKTSLLPTQTDTQFPTKTSSPPTKTDTPFPTKTPSATLSPERISLLATRDAIEQKLSTHCVNPNPWSMELSPDRIWAVFSCSGEVNNDPDSIKFIRVDETKEWGLSYLEVYGSKHNSAEGSLGVYHWSQDGSYAYIAASPQMDGFGFAFYQAAALYGLNLQTGEMSEILPSGTNRNFYSFEFSPNDEILAYFDWHTKSLTLFTRDMHTGENQSVILDPKYDSGGSFVWSPDSQKLVFSAAQYNVDTDKYVVSILLWDKELNMLKTLVQDSQMLLKASLWQELNKVVIIDRLEGTKFEFDIEQNELIKITP